MGSELNTLQLQKIAQDTYFALATNPTPVQYTRFYLAQINYLNALKREQVHLEQDTSDTDRKLAEYAQKLLKQGVKPLQERSYEYKVALNRRKSRAKRDVKVRVEVPTEREMMLRDMECAVYTLGCGKTYTAPDTRVLIGET